MRILLFLSLIVGIIVGMICIVPAYADTFESVDSKDYLFLEIDNNKVSGLLQIDGKITSINDSIKYYKNGNFKIKLFNDSMLLYGSLNSLKVTVYDLTERQKTHYSIQKLDTKTPYEKIVEKKLTPLEKSQQAQNQTGLGNIAEQKRIEKERLDAIEEQKRLQEIANKTPRNQYQKIDDTLELIVKSDFHVPLFTTFDFSLRSIDQTVNKYSQFFGGGYLKDVEIIAKIITPDGKVKKTISGATDKEGYFTGIPLFMPDNTPLNQEWTLEVSGIKYFDDIEKFSTFSVVESFFVITNPSNKSPICGSNQILATNGTCISP